MWLFTIVFSGQDVSQCRVFPTRVSSDCLHNPPPSGWTKPLYSVAHLQPLYDHIPQQLLNISLSFRFNAVQSTGPETQGQSYIIPPVGHCLQLLQDTEAVIFTCVYNTNRLYTLAVCCPSHPTLAQSFPNCLSPGKAAIGDINIIIAMITHQVSDLRGSMPVERKVL